MCNDPGLDMSKPLMINLFQGVSGWSLMSASGKWWLLDYRRLSSTSAPLVLPVALCFLLTLAFVWLDCELHQKLIWTKNFCSFLFVFGYVFVVVFVFGFVLFF